MIDINEGDHQQCGDKEKVDQGGGAWSELHPCDHGKDAREHFNNGITNGYGGFASTATTAQQDVADHRKVIEPLDGSVAHRA